jgi:hypothetical protein
MVTRDSDHFVNNLEEQVSVFMFLSDRVAQLYPQASDSLFVASYVSQGCGGGIVTRLRMGQMPE